MENSYELGVTYNCNWHCEYCIVDTHDQHEKKFEVVYEEAMKYDNNSSVTLTGGEPGMLSSIEIKSLISLLKRKNIVIDLVTNGLFFEKHYTSIPYISEIFYHCVENLSDKKDIKHIIDKDDFYYILVASTNELNENLTYYFDKYPNIKFIISPNVKPGERIDIGKFMKFIKKYSNNIHPRTLEEFIKNTTRT